MGALSYADSGVDRELADRLVEKIGLLSKSTLNQRVKSSIGGFASLFELDRRRWIAASTDGVGTKLKLAFSLREHRTVGIDLVAMSVNDLLCVGAEPLFFLDYFATGKLEEAVAEQVLEGIVKGCQQAKCALVGGETAEMPDFYCAGEYDLGGFAVGVVQSNKVLPKKSIRPGDILVGLRSSGCHSNGYSLLRKWIPSGSKGEAVTRDLLTPTRIYVKALLPLLKSQKIKGLAHITGSGFLNVPRISENVSYEIQLPPQSERPAIYEWVTDRSKLPFKELAQTFNLGIGMVIVISSKDTTEVLKKIKDLGEIPWIVGEVRAKIGSSRPQVFLRDEANSVTLNY